MEYPKFSTYSRAESNLVKNGFNFVREDRTSPLEGVKFTNKNYISFVKRIRNNHYEVYTFKTTK